MKTEIDSFNKAYHEQVLKEFSDRLLECNFKLINPIVRIAIDPRYIFSIQDLTFIRHKTEKIVIIGQHLTLLVPIDVAVVKVYESDDSFLDVNIGIPTVKGYRSKVRELEDFKVDQNLNLTSKSIEKMKQFVHDFRVWNGKEIYNHSHIDSDNDDNRSSHEKYNGAYGFDDDTIDSAFEGDPENYWNID